MQVYAAELTFRHDTLYVVIKIYETNTEQNSRQQPNHLLNVKSEIENAMCTFTKTSI